MSTHLDLNQLKNKAIGVNYQWDETTHLLRAGVDKQRNLYILDWCKFPPHTLSATIAEYVREYKKYIVHSNDFQPLSVEINSVGGSCRQYDEAIVKTLPTFYKNLEASGRFHVIEGICLPNKDLDFVLCMSFLLKGLMTALCKEPKNNFFMTTIPSWRSQQEEYPTAPRRVSELEEMLVSLKYSRESTEILENGQIKTIWGHQHFYPQTTVYDGAYAVALY